MKGPIYVKRATRKRKSPMQVMGPMKMKGSTEVKGQAHRGEQSIMTVKKLSPLSQL